MIIRAVDTQRINRHTHIAAYLNPTQRHEAAEYARAAGRNVEYVGTTGLKITRKTIMDRQRAWTAAHPVAYRITLFCALLTIPYIGWAIDAYYAIKWTREARHNHTTHPTKTRRNPHARAHGWTPRKPLTPPLHTYTAHVTSSLGTITRTVFAPSELAAYADVWTRLRETVAPQSLHLLNVYITEA